MSEITVNMLKHMCEEIIAKGYGDKTILISSDDEGNEFHTLYCGFVTNIEDIKLYKCLFHDNNNPNDVVLLG